MHNATEPGKRTRKGNGAAGAAPPPAADPEAGILKLDPIKDTIADLVQLYRAARDATTELSEAIEGAATRAQARPAVVRKFVAARAGDKFPSRKAEVEQLAFLFERIGE